MSTLWQRMRASFERWRRFINYDVWRIGLPGEEIPSSFVIKQVRVAILLVRGIAEETLLLRAAALTFATLLFIVPFLVFMFSFIQTFHLGDEVYSLLSQKLNEKLELMIDTIQEGGGEAAEEAPATGTEEVDEPTDIPAEAQPGEAAPVEDGAEDAEPEEAPVLKDGAGDTEPEEAPPLEDGAEDAEPEEAPVLKDGAGDAQLRRELLELLFPWRDTLNEGELEYEDPIAILVGIADKTATSGSALGISGLIFVLTTVFGLMRNVEWSLNRIWGVKRSRSYFRTTSDYLLVTLLLPFVAAAVLGVTAAMASEAVKSLLGPFAIILRLGQFGFVTLSFATLYFFVPNTKVQFRNAFIGGVFAAVLWIALSWVYVHAHVGLARYALIFSTFAAFPLLLMWVYASWIVLLLGAIVSFAYQNDKTFAMERLSDQAPFAYSEAVAVRVLIESARRFQKGDPGLSAADMAVAWNIPLRLLNKTLDCLTGARLLVPCATEPVTYQPARAPSATRVRDAVIALREAGTSPSLLRQDEQYAPLYAALDTADPEFLDSTLVDAAAKLPAEEAEE